MNVPHRVQEQPNSCLSACVRMALAYYGVDFAEAELRRLHRSPLDRAPCDVGRLRSCAACSHRDCNLRFCGDGQRPDKDRTWSGNFKDRVHGCLAGVGFLVDRYSAVGT